MRRPTIDPADVTAILHAAARAGTALTYAEVLNALGLAFSRPKMRALCVVLDDVDAGERGASRPALACLVVRASDGLPGQGWWLSRRDYADDFTGPAAHACVAACHAEVFAYWATAGLPTTSSTAETTGVVNGISRPQRHTA